MRRLPTRIALPIVTLAVACSRSQPPPPPPPAAIPSYSRAIAPVLERMCATARDCHGADPTLDIALDLRRGSSYAQLVNRPAQARAGAMRVKAGDPAASFLVDKLLGKLGPREGKQMPLDAQTGAPIVPSPIDRGYIDSILTPWIAAGAPNN